ncbi:ABC transporter permease subunit [Plesiomonas shigelloides]|uniref:ABC transporter permease subunit n=1 Tax=Plesiomonas shigelloides TaxID=703 RepID=UPI0012626FAC|nr:ABC transporter permease subunit [Plesiomonas shigelloides]KAB7692553.1 ABC transporter permease subunit [Plesiomonas shigelloides]
MVDAVSLSLKGSKSRALKDKLAKYGVTGGGMLVLVALMLIFFYLLYVILPLFKSASVEKQQQVSVNTQKPALALGLDERSEAGYRLTTDGELTYIQLAADRTQPPGTVLLQQKISPNSTSVGYTIPSVGIYALGNADGSVSVVQPQFSSLFGTDNQRHTTPKIKYPLGETPLLLDSQKQPLVRVAVSVQEDSAELVGLTADHRLLFGRYSEDENMLSGETEWRGDVQTIADIPKQINELLLTPNGRFLYLLSGKQLHIFDLRGDAPELREVVTLSQDTTPTKLALMPGGSSLLVATDDGRITQWFDVNKGKGPVLTQIRELENHAGPLVQLQPEYFRRGFVTLSDNGNVGLYYTTSANKLLQEKLLDKKPNALTISSRANGLLLEEDGSWKLYQVHNEHPEVSWSALWDKVWYEGYREPQYVWQSTSASDDFESKLSLVPISFGTLKAAFYAMLFAVPLALAGAIYTAYFMSPGMRKAIKPTVEIMGALPTVILGFLAGLWLAPVLEQYLTGVLTFLVLLPVSILLTAFVWGRLPERLRSKEGWDALVLVPVILLVGYGSFSASSWIDHAFFGGNIRDYLSNDLGITFDQRNALVVGIAMGFAVIPNIFSIAEDAIFSVPRNLTNGSLALGATPWQTLTRVVLLTASPGIFSAVMIGLGRAVGETMIVLMATGNTPILDWSIFQGLRTLAANIAVEMPEAEVASTHYRVLFLTAFVLFVFTFVFNTIAEYIRQRLRDKYSSL